MKNYLQKTLKYTRMEAIYSTKTSLDPFSIRSDNIHIKVCFCSGKQPAEGFER